MSEATKVDSTRHGSKVVWKCELPCSTLCSAGRVYERQYSAAYFVLMTNFAPLLQAAFPSYTSAHADRLPRFPAHTLLTVHRRRALGLPGVHSPSHRLRIPVPIHRTSLSKLETAISASCAVYIYRRRLDNLNTWPSIFNTSYVIVIWPSLASYLVGTGGRLFFRRKAAKARSWG